MRKIEDIEDLVKFENGVLKIIFDDRNPNWITENSPEEDRVYNQTFLRAQERYANDLLAVHGRLYVNEILNILNFPTISEGYSYGWLKKDGDYVKFDTQHEVDYIVVIID